MIAISSLFDGQRLEHEGDPFYPWNPLQHFEFELDGNGSHVIHHQQPKESILRFLSDITPFAGFLPPCDLASATFVLPRSTHQEQAMLDEFRKDLAKVGMCSKFPARLDVGKVEGYGITDQEGMVNATAEHGGSARSSLLCLTHPEWVLYTPTARCLFAIWRTFRDSPQRLVPLYLVVA